jgi:hypothetical protein
MHVQSSRLLHHLEHGLQQLLGSFLLLATGHALGQLLAKGYHLCGTAAPDAALHGISQCTSSTTTTMLAYHLQECIQHSWWVSVTQ